MIRKISIAELRPGMKVVETGLSWMEHPYLYTEAVQITSERQVAAIREEGYREVFVQDPEADPEFEDQPLLNGREQNPRPDHRTPPTGEEYAQAYALYEASFGMIRSFIRDAKLGRPIDRDASEHLLAEVIGNVTKSPDAMVSLIKLKAYDDYTYTHCINVAVLSVVFGQYLGLGGEELHKLGEAGLFHDLGKLKVPDAILNKPGRLSPEEFEVVKFHPDAGAEILERQGGFPEEVVKAVREHHERFNGTGYGQGLSGDRQSLAAQIISLADVYDALTSNRSYRNAMLPNTAMRILFAMRDKDFSRELVERFIKCLGIYPVGSLVRLKNGEVALVCGSNTASPLFPTVKIIMDRNMYHRPHLVLDLSSPEAKALGEGVTIAGPLDQTAPGIDPFGFLF